MERPGTVQFTDVAQAMGHLRAVTQTARLAGWDIWGGECRRLNPGDVFDAYEAIHFTPDADDDPDAGRCGPFAAVVRFAEREQGNLAWRTCNWRQFVDTMYCPLYVEGFLSGFSLRLPAAFTAELPGDALRGVHDGVMAHAAVF